MRFKELQKELERKRKQEKKPQKDDGGSEYEGSSSDESSSSSSGSESLASEEDFYKGLAAAGMEEDSQGEEGPKADRPIKTKGKTLAGKARDKPEGNEEEACLKDSEGKLLFTRSGYGKVMKHSTGKPVELDINLIT